MLSPVVSHISMATCRSPVLSPALAAGARLAGPLSPKLAAGIAGRRGLMERLATGADIYIHESAPVEYKHKDVKEGDVFELVEGMMAAIFAEAAGISLDTPFPRIAYDDEVFGTITVKSFEVNQTVDPALFADMDRLPGFFMARYQGRPEFDEALFTVAGDRPAA